MNNVKNKKLFVYNLALKRQDGKVEQDTVYRETLLTAQDVEKIGIDFSCSVLVSCVGTYRVADDNFIKDNTFIYELPKPQEVNNSQVIAEDAELEEELSDCDICGLCENGGGC